MRRNGADSHSHIHMHILENFTKENEDDSIHYFKFKFQRKGTHTFKKLFVIMYESFLSYKRTKWLV